MSRQTMLFSATIPDEIRNLAERYLLHPKTVRMHEGTRVTRTVHHLFYPVAERKKEALLLEILARENPQKVLIFTATREATSVLASALRRRRYSVVSLSSLLSQANRERVLDAFRAGEYRILVATDVAARGLDITDIDLVINFDVPTQPEDYVHRIGRTGRMERRGKAVTLVSPVDRRRAADVERMLGEKVEQVEIEGFVPEPGDRATAGRGGRGGRGGRPAARGKDRKRSGGRGRSRGPRGGSR